MNPIIRNILAVLTGIVVGSMVNMNIINISDLIIPLPEGVDLTSTEGMVAAMQVFEPRHFIMPFLAHALGTLVGAFLAALIAANNNMKFALGIGGFTLIGGIMAVVLFKAPMWYNAIDLIGAYFPMAWIGGTLAGRFTKKQDGNYQENLDNFQENQ